MIRKASPPYFNVTKLDGVLLLRQARRELSGYDKNFQQDLQNEAPYWEENFA